MLECTNVQVPKICPRQSQKTVRSDRRTLLHLINLISMMVCGLAEEPPPSWSMVLECISCVKNIMIIFLEFYLRKGNFPYLGMRHKIISGHTLLCAKTNLEVIGSCVSTSRIRMTDCGVLEILLRRRSNYCPATAWTCSFQLTSTTRQFLDCASPISFQSLTCIAASMPDVLQLCDVIMLFDNLFWKWGKVK